MERLLDIGFEQAGHWIIDNGNLEFELNRFATRHNVLYAFVVNNEVKYVGKTIKTLMQRMRWYRKPSKTQITNIRNNSNIVKCLQQGDVVDIYVLPDSGLIHYGVFHLNLAAGLEDSVIKKLNPEWNGGRKEIISVDEPIEAEIIDAFSVIDEFILTLHKTYYTQGFFNAPVKQSDLFASDGERIEIYLKGSNSPIVGIINRRANSNNAPRIMGTHKLRNYFIENHKVMDQIKVGVLSKYAIRLD
ncbi:GIY-YIG nuclease family protein [Pseudomonas sp. o96-267]|uniref:GIY-YIG nuclease family protein n=1 Tax=Pseudomonas sp. o96-267 TaxID=2479853 RepID=UPI0015AD5240|nr:GIY-YIG nuclease family protein [Pseudomonas sp. o96-267]